MESKKSESSKDSQAENKFKGKFIAIKPDYKGLKISNGAGLSIAKGEFQNHPAYKVDEEVFEIFDSKEKALKYVLEKYPNGIPVKSSRDRIKKEARTGKPSREEMMANAKLIGAGGITTSKTVEGFNASSPIFGRK